MTTFPSSPPDHDEIDIWTIPLDTNHDSTEALKKLLDTQELERYDKLHPNHQHRYLVSHAACRQILGGYTNTSAKQISYNKNDHGKPALDHENPVYFNLTHSHDLAILAISKYSEIGVDVEYFKNKASWKKIAQRFFTETEVSYLQNQPEDMQENLFFQIWTRKEAYIKAIGTGLSTSLSSFDATTSKTIKPLNSTKSKAIWYQEDLNLSTQYTGAVAQNTPIKKIRYYSY